MASAKEIKEFRENGYFILPNFLTEDEVESMKKECENLVEEMNPVEHYSSFHIEDHEHKERDEYFLNSSDKVRFFFEDCAFNSKGEPVMSKHRSLNRIGHALHWLCPAFRKVTFSQKVKDLISSLEYEDPVVVQSLYIFKNPEVGGLVKAHQDSTFLNTDPPSVLGLWFALEEVTLDNGCLKFVPGSHKGPLYECLKRNPEKEGPSLIMEGQKIEFEESQYVPCPAPKGSCVVIHGLVVHKSEKNVSSKPRPAYTFHVVERKGTIYSPENWLQPTPEYSFPSFNNLV
ncbi:phytanoyl-CoA dioxygenase domain-containing protein 1-like isoform X1 [Tachypleus tridentatus]|uniref:phytanoyl-CoA dioxygenase domain-containing protein 1-like isoform X1 n=2 Tax=Tachypleus tridentatus TaxID=6853 RepID=UPI003FD464A1